MKVFRVLTERDGKTVKAPGISETEIKREEWRYAADTIQQVWAGIQDKLNDPECLVLAVHEEHPAIIVLPSPDTREESK